MAVNILGVVIILIFYVAIVIVGIFAAKRFPLGSRNGGSRIELSMVAGRNLSLGVAMFTMAATFVGGGFINGTAEGVASAGLVWTLAPFGIMLGTCIGGLAYAPPMRRRRYVTMLDPLQERYGDVMTGLLFLGALLGDLLWSASILGALGTSLSVIVGVPVWAAIVVSAVVGVAYTVFGQMVAVAYTDILQLFFMVVGLVLAVPFAYYHPAVSNISETSSVWLGTIKTASILAWVDLAIIQIIGSIPWQTYFQRVLSCRTVAHARLVSIVGGVSALALGVPPMLIGAIGASTNWNATDLGTSPIGTPDVNKILPLVLQYLTPPPVAIIGLSAVVAAVMSSLDSIILSSSSMFTHNVYRMSLKPKASQYELMVVQRVSLVVTATISTVLSIFVQSIYQLFFLAADIVSIVLFPQLTCALITKTTNAYGSFIGLVLGLFLRIAGGDQPLGLPALIKYPMYSETSGQLFPFKTAAMLSALFSNLIVSNVTRVLFVKGVLPVWMDVVGAGQISTDFEHDHQNPSVSLSKF